MQSPSPANTNIAFPELLAFHRPKVFHLFLYSRNTNNLPIFLLHKSLDSPIFSHFPGEFTKYDPVIYTAVARELLSKTAGLLYTPNLKYLLADNANPLVLDEIILESIQKIVMRTRMGWTPVSDDIIRLLGESPHVYQESNGTMVFFIQLPMLSLEAIKEAAIKKDLGFEMGYFSFEDILNTNNQQISEELKKALENKELLAYLRKYIVNNESVEITGHYAIVSCDSKNKVALVPGLHYSIYKKHGEKWSFYRAYEGELPTDEELRKLKGLIIPGSGHSAHDATVPWFKEVFEFIKKVVYEYKHINFLGVCFGAQIAAQALGGRVEKMPRPFIRGGDILKTQDSFYELDYIKNLGLDRNRPLVIGEAHGDHIVELPKEAVLHSSSENTNVEIYTIGNNVLALQGHPEFNEPWTAGRNYIAKGLSEIDYDRYAEEYIKEKFLSPVTQDEILKFCYHFLKKEIN